MKDFTMRLAIFGALISVLSAGCVGTHGDPCEAAAARIAECGASVPSGFQEQCTTEDAEEILALDCGALTETGGAGKADGALGWRELGDACWFNFECSDDLVCRPTGPETGSAQQCLQAGRETHRLPLFLDYCGGWCDSDEDCLPDHFCADENIAYNGMCIVVGHNSGSAQDSCEVIRRTLEGT